MLQSGQIQMAHALKCAKTQEWAHKGKLISVMAIACRAALTKLIILILTGQTIRYAGHSRFL